MWCYHNSLCHISVVAAYWAGAGPGSRQRRLCPQWPGGETGERLPWTPGHCCHTLHTRAQQITYRDKEAALVLNKCWFGNVRKQKILLREIIITTWLLYMYTFHTIDWHCTSAQPQSPDVVSISKENRVSVICGKYPRIHPLKTLYQGPLVNLSRS